MPAITSKEFKSYIHHCKNNLEVLIFEIRLSMSRHNSFRCRCSRKKGGYKSKENKFHKLFW